MRGMNLNLCILQILEGTFSLGAAYIKELVYRHIYHGINSVYLRFIRAKESELTISVDVIRPIVVLLTFRVPYQLLSGCVHTRIQTT